MIPFVLKSTPHLPGIDKERRAVYANLKSCIGHTTSKYLTDLYSREASRRRINKYLKETELYDSDAKRWVSIPQTAKDQKSLAIPLLEVIGGIIDDMGRKGRRDTREAEGTWTLPGLLHGSVKINKGFRSSPSIVVTATGSSFETPNDPACPQVGYTNITTCIDVRANCEEWDEEDRVYELGLYAKQIFAHQPNRKFVRCIFFTETEATFVHFDRAGAQCAPPIMYHEDPHTLIRVILGLSSFNEEVLGLDTSITWLIKDGKKLCGCIRTVAGTDDDLGGSTPYDLRTKQRPREMLFPMKKLKPIFASTDIVGRGTTCWSVAVPETREPLIVKDAWKVSGVEPEYRFLEMAKGIKGVAQLVSYDADRRTISSARGPTRPGTGRRSLMKNETRVVMRGYGKRIDNFKSEKQLLGAMRDAIAGHRSLVLEREVNIVHRDISHNNILLNDDEDEDAPRGVLIDFDMAKRERTLKTGPDLRPAGTYLYMAIGTLQRYETDGKYVNCFGATWQDYLCDLESFFYVLLVITFTYEGPSRKRSGDAFPDFIADFTQEDESRACEAKMQFLGRQLSLEGLSDYWSPATRALLVAFHRLVRNTWSHKEILVTRWHDEPDQHRLDFSEVHNANPDAKYEDILKAFDKALWELDVAENTPPCTPENLPSPDTTPESYKKRVRKWAKRDRDVLPQVGDAPLNKRRRVSLSDFDYTSTDDHSTICNKRRRVLMSDSDRTSTVDVDEPCSVSI